MRSSSKIVNFCHTESHRNKNGVEFLQSPIAAIKSATSLDVAKCLNNLARSRFVSGQTRLVKCLKTLIQPCQHTFGRRNKEFDITGKNSTQQTESVYFV